MLGDMQVGARDWLRQNGYGAGWTSKDGHSIVGDLELEEHERTRFHGSAIGVLLVRGEPVHVAQARLNVLREWKRREAGRWIAVMHEKDVAPEYLVQLGEFDQTVTWPRQNYYPAHTQSPPSLGN